MRRVGGGGNGGLSPRVRGNPDPHSLVGAGVGSIPACAGEPGLSIHPSKNGKGLSPRVRGNRRNGVQARTRSGSIPACAGEPANTSPASSPIPVYPRVCGGTWCWGFSSLTMTGLSPRVRGNPSPEKTKPANGRSIPACAGEPQLLAIADGNEKVYPRVCGGTRTKNPNKVATKGLSPRVRGNLFL